METAAEPGKTVVTTYGYDKANNRTSKVVATTPIGGSTATETHAYVFGNSDNGLNSNQIWKWIKPSPGAEVVYSYDANGNRATRTETVNSVPTSTDTYTWDHWNRLVELDLQSKDASANGAYEYTYDHRTRRVVRDESAIPGRTRDIVVFSSGTSVQEHEGETGPTPANAATPGMEYIRGSDWGGGVGGILYTSRASVLSWAHYNGRGDVVTRTSDAGSLTYAASYEAFGTRTQEAGTNPDRQRANTKEEDPTGLLNEGHRYRDLELGMFISRDPAGFVDGPNVYTYVVQNPWSSFDPEGLSEKPTAPKQNAQKQNNKTGEDSARTVSERQWHKDTPENRKALIVSLAQEAYDKTKKSDKPGNAREGISTKQVEHGGFILVNSETGDIARSEVTPGTKDEWNPNSIKRGENELILYDLHSHPDEGDWADNFFSKGDLDNIAKTSAMPSQPKYKGGYLVGPDSRLVYMDGEKAEMAVRTDNNSDGRPYYVDNHGGKSGMKPIVFGGNDPPKIYLNQIKK